MVRCCTGAAAMAIRVARALVSAAPGLLLAIAAAGTPAAADTVISGKSAQALRCAAYIGMAAQYGHAEGLVSTDDRNLMTFWSVLVLERWVPLAPEGRMAAYREALGEIGTRSETVARISRHADWCLQTFRPAL
ncbi:MAG TPA: hypothetical protein VM891_15505 [Amaricoccus sp.]|nr:hypothetical protein [Amaricoccus sp.]